MRWRSRWVVSAVLLLASVLPLAPAPVAASAAAAASRDGEVIAVGPVSDVGDGPEGAVAIVATPGGLGFWAVSAIGAVVTGGWAPHLGDAAGLPLARPIVGMAATPSGNGYWLVAADGNVFTFGDAPFLGSAHYPGRGRSIVGMAATPSGAGYWLVGSDGAVSSFGDAPFFGSAGGITIDSPIVGMAATTTGRGYWLAAADGAVFTFGDAPFGGTGERDTVGITAAHGAYFLVTRDGRVSGRHGGHDLGSGGLDGVAGFASSGLGGWLVVGPPRHLLDVWQPGGLTDDSVQFALDLAGRIGAGATVLHRFNADLLVVRAGDHVRQAAPAGFRYPMSALAVDADHGEALVGRTVADALRRGDVAMGRRSAQLRGAQVGDAVEILAPDGNVHVRTIGALADDTRTNEAELVFGTGDAHRMGFSRPLTVRIWGASTAAIHAAASEVPGHLGVDLSWRLPADLDEPLTSVRLKELLGEVAYRPTSGDSVQLDPAWTGPNLATESVPRLGRVTCARAVFEALRGALAEVVNAGLGGGLGRYGGCYNARRIRGGDSGGYLSRHSFGIAIDVNTANNSFGGRVSMDPRIVDIFRRWGFAWGGTWVRADGMHFEWTGWP